ncbi:hypothetical protein FGO68_gene15397 [Halteria grandinella]|uniref:Uncharacterized protein n=1 Tax=Halteria grandinella TaxID=5974 RepID=A0A8J8NKX6_HALGN|nr:hypothetical protein FGO68_gene15397 [Halteria grandinella]
MSEIATILHDVFRYGTAGYTALSAVVIFFEQIGTIFTPSAWTGSSIMNYLIVMIVAGLLESIHVAISAGLGQMFNFFGFHPKSFTTQGQWVVYTIAQSIVTLALLVMSFFADGFAIAINDWWISVGGAAYGAIDYKAYKLGAMVSILFPLSDVIYGVSQIIITSFV